jgi:serine/threonine protein kinase
MASIDPETLFELQGELGAGTYGRVFAGRDRKTGEAVAIKIIPVQEDVPALRHEVRCARLPLRARLD